MSGTGSPTSRFHPRHRPKGGVTPFHLERLYGLLGREHDVNEVARTLRTFVQGERAPAVGAMHVTCSDEAERECVLAFDRNFARYLLPNLKFHEKAVFRGATLGGRYEWGAVRMAEAHYAQAAGAQDGKLLVVKVNAHVSVDEAEGDARFGRMERYGEDSSYCGVLAALLDGTHLPAIDELERAFRTEELDRLTLLRDPSSVEPRHRMLFAAVVGARLQARRVMLDVQDHDPVGPTLYCIVPCVTLNRRGHDTELVCGIYMADRRDEPHDEYCGLGDDPRRYEVRHVAGKLEVHDHDLDRPRGARDHRRMVLERWAAHPEQAEAMAALEHPRVTGALGALEQALAAGQHPVARASLMALVPLLAEFAAVPAAVLLFGAGVSKIHHAHKAHRLARDAQGDELAREVLRGIEGELQGLPPERLEHVVELLRQGVAAG